MARSRLSPEAAREAIGAAALALLEEEGRAGVSLRRLAVRLGATTGQLYHHFSNKDEILQLVVARGFSVLDRYLEPADEVSNPADKVRRLASGYLRFAEEHGALYELVFDAELARRVPSERLRELYTPEEAEARDRSFDRMLGAVARGLEAGAFSDVTPFEGASFMWMTLHGTAELHIRGWTRDPAGGQKPHVAAFLARIPDLLVRALSTDQSCRQSWSPPHPSSG